jgi:hypothetical protein
MITCHLPDDTRTETIWKQDRRRFESAAERRFAGGSEARLNFASRNPSSNKN